MVAGPDNMATDEGRSLEDLSPDSPDNIALWAGAFGQSPLPIAITVGRTHIVHFANAAFARLARMEAQELLNHAFGDLFPSADDGARVLLDRVLSSGEPVVIPHHEHILPERREVLWTYTVWPIFDQQGAALGLVLQASDSTDQILSRRNADQAALDLRMVNEQLVLTGLREQELATVARHLALHDNLTGLPNRALFMDRLEQTLSTAQRDPVAFAVLLLDLDRFKTVNDTLGHLAGDRFLQEVARRLLACVRPEDTVARLGGDEFALLLEEIEEVSEVVHIAERIHESLNELFDIAGQFVAGSASIGIVLSTPRYTHVSELLQDADTALYRAKALGKARYVIFDTTVQNQALALTRLEADLRRAVIQDEFVLHYQPIVSLDTGTIIGVETLLRWQHPERGSVLPGEFLVVVEESGLMIPLGEWVLRTACAQMSSWHAAGFQSLYVAVNLSARQLQQRDLVEMIARIVQHTGLDPEFLHLELTETSVMADITASSATFQQLTALGVQVSVDDFGTGYSSLSYLRRLPLTTVKVDRSFIDEVASNPDDAAITAAIIAMAHRLKFQVIAEGVETEAQLAYLRAEACDAIQGYLVSRPVPAAAMTQHLMTGSAIQLP